jgi:hypothetical protein
MANLSADSQSNWRLQSRSAKRSIQPLVTFLGIFALFAAITVILFWPWMPHLHSALIGPPEDNMLDFWNTWYASVATKPDGFFLPI